MSDPSHSNINNSKSHNPRPRSKSKIKDTLGLQRTLLSSNWLDRSWNRHGDTSQKPQLQHADDERVDKILEVDTWKPRLNTKKSDRTFTTPHCNYKDHGPTIFYPLSKHTRNSQKQNPSVSSAEVSSLRSDQAPAWTSENSPLENSASSRAKSAGRQHPPISPARSECVSNFPVYPNYMASTESSLSRVRSHSVPRQRMQFEKLGSTKRFGRGFWDANTISEKGSAKSYGRGC